MSRFTIIINSLMALILAEMLTAGVVVSVKWPWCVPGTVASKLVTGNGTIFGISDYVPITNTYVYYSTYNSRSTWSAAIAGFGTLYIWYSTNATQWLIGPVIGTEEPPGGWFYMGSTATDPNGTYNPDGSPGTTGNPVVTNTP